MPKNYKSAAGYYKFYNKTGTPCRIKCSPVSGSCIIQFKEVQATSWLYHVPDKKFKNCLEVVNFILKNLVNKDMIFKIAPTCNKGLGKSWADVK